MLITLLSNYILIYKLRTTKFGRDAHIFSVLIWLSFCLDILIGMLMNSQIGSLKDQGKVLEYLLLEF